MKILYRVRIDPAQVRKDCQKDGYLADYGKIIEYTRGEAIKKARMFGGKIEKAPAKVIAKKRYKLWLSIEECTEFTDGTEEFKDLEDIDATASFGQFDTPEAARKFLKNLCDNYGGE
jgi:hypothetical protein